MCFVRFFKGPSVHKTGVGIIESVRWISDVL